VQRPVSEPADSVVEEVCDLNGLWMLLTLLQEHDPDIESDQLVPEAPEPRQRRTRRGQPKVRAPYLRKVHANTLCSVVL
jgi:hypothetical protein